MDTALTWLAVAFAAVGTLALMILAARRVFLARRERRTQALEARLTPLALELIAGEVDELPLAPDDQQVLAGLLARYSRRLHGAERARIAHFFEAHGGLE